MTEKPLTRSSKFPEDFACHVMAIFTLYPLNSIRFLGPGPVELTAPQLRILPPFPPNAAQSFSKLRRAQLQMWPARVLDNGLQTEIFFQAKRQSLLSREPFAIQSGMWVHRLAM